MSSRSVQIFGILSTIRTVATEYKAVETQMVRGSYQRQGNSIMLSVKNRLTVLFYGCADLDQRCEHPVQMSNLYTKHVTE